MKLSYVTPQIDVLCVFPTQMLCLSLNGGTESYDQSDLEDIVIDDPFIL